MLLRINPNNTRDGLHLLIFNNGALIDVIAHPTSAEPSFRLLTLCDTHPITRATLHATQAPDCTPFGHVSGKPFTPSHLRRVALYAAFLSAELRGYGETPSGHVNNTCTDNISPLASLADPRCAGNDFETYHDVIFK